MVGGHAGHYADDGVGRAAPTAEPRSMSEEPMTQLEPLADAVSRTVETRRDADRVHLMLALSAPMDTPPANLWSLLADPALFATWYTLPRGDFREGGLLTTDSGAQGRILDVEAPHRVRLNWSRRGATGPLEIRVDPQDDGSSEFTLLRTLTVSAERFDTDGPGAIALPWDVLVDRLARRTGSWGRPQQLVLPSVDAWMRTQEAQGAVRAWAIRWAAAALADGAAEDTARRGEQVTASLYSRSELSAGRAG